MYVDGYGHGYMDSEGSIDIASERARSSERDTGRTRDRASEIESERASEIAVLMRRHASVDAQRSLVSLRGGCLLPRTCFLRRHVVLAMSERWMDRERTRLM